MAAFLGRGLGVPAYASPERPPGFPPTTPLTATSTDSSSTTSANPAPGAIANPPAPPFATQANASNVPPPAAPDALATAPTTEPGATAAPASTDANEASGAPAARASQAGVEALRDLPAAQAAENATPPAIAKITPPKPAVPPRPKVPTIAVVASGDDVIASPAGDALQSLLQSRGFRVIEGHGDARSFAGRADAVIVINARPVGTQELQYYGQNSTLYTVQLGVKAYRVPDGSVLWTSSPEQVNFTSLNAAEKAREAIEPMLDTVDSRLAEFRSRDRRG
jgi:serine/threonine-protein kinase